MTNDKVVRVDKETIKVLNTMHDKFMSDVDSSDYEEYMTFGDIISFALFEYNQKRDPSFLRREQKRLEENYVTKQQYGDLKTQFSKLYNSNATDRKEQDKQIEDYKKKIQSLQDEGAAFKIRLEEHKKLNNTLQKKISDKDAESDVSKNDMNVLLKKQEELSRLLADSQNRYHDLSIEHNAKCSYIKKRCIDITDLHSLLLICRFLFKHRKRWFSAAEIHETLWDKNVTEISDVLKLSEFDIFPVIQGQSKRGDIFKYDSRYLRLPLAQVLGFQ